MMTSVPSSRVEEAARHEVNGDLEAKWFPAHKPGAMTPVLSTPALVALARVSTRVIVRQCSRAMGMMGHEVEVSEEEIRKLGGTATTEQLVRLRRESLVA